ncbi:MAG: hypothetical protein LC745_04105 [Planctomycetia bacterium]|nr:hypothetical protein [Planctomycetia bacterium]
MRGLTIAAHLAIGLSVALAADPARGQSVGYGSSPGRAAYRPDAQWNNGPFYTVPHVNPYAPRPTAPTNLYGVEPQAPPWSTEPHGLYSPYYPGRGVLNPYSEGFSPYSGFSAWYARDYGVEGNREQVQQARTLFFRSAPRPPVGVLPPLPPPSPVTISPQAVSRPDRPPLPGRPPAGPARAAIPVYRSSVTGSR